MSPKLSLPEQDETIVVPAPVPTVNKLEPAAGRVSVSRPPKKLTWEEAEPALVQPVAKLDSPFDNPELAASLSPPTTRHAEKFELNDPSALTATPQPGKLAGIGAGGLGPFGDVAAKSEPAKYNTLDVPPGAEPAAAPVGRSEVKLQPEFEVEANPATAKSASAKSPEIGFGELAAQMPPAPAIVFRTVAPIAPVAPSASKELAAAVAPRAATVAVAPAIWKALPAARPSTPVATPVATPTKLVVEAPTVPSSVPEIVFAHVEWVVVSPAAPGTRPAGVAPEDAARHVRGMFERIAPRYDFCNRVLSAGFDGRWRARAVRKLTARLPAAAQRRRGMVDVCCGTGDLALALCARMPAARVAGADFSRAMLERAGRKARGRAPQPVWVEADALQMPWADDSLAAVTTAFGFRNLAAYEAALREFHRVLQPGGALAILEFSRPRTPLVRQAFGFYFRHILPLLGGLLSGSRASYRYLPESVNRFPSAEGLAQWLRAAGFERVEFERFTFGIAVLHLANKPTS